MPRRRCVGCGRVAAKGELVRIAVERGQGARAEARAVADRAGTMPGRGAYLCRAGDRADPLAACLTLALRRGGIARTLRSSVPLDREIVELVGA